MVKMTIFGLSLNFPGIGTPIGTPQTAFRAAKRCSEAGTLTPRRNFNFRANFNLKKFFSFSNQTTIVVNCGK